MPYKILVVDDEPDIAELVELYLLNEGYEVYKCFNATDGLELMEVEDVSLAILDVMLPDMNGFTLCQRIREKHMLPIIMLTAKVENTDKITGLTLGADDYVTKPFNPLELVARVKTQLRRYTRYNVNHVGGDEKQAHDFSGLNVVRASRKCFLYGEQVTLTPIEFDILWYLCENRGKVVSSEELFEAVWKDKYMDNNNTVMAHIARLRDKLKEPSRKPRFIKTVWGVGYTIEA